MSVDLSRLHPVLVSAIGKILAEMQAQSTPMKIAEGFRTRDEQHRRWLQGRVQEFPGKIVTQCDGVLKPSQHQSGRAVDCCFLGPDPYGESHPWGKYGDLVRAAGLVWGGDFKNATGQPRPDRPHAELPKGIQ